MKSNLSRVTNYEVLGLDFGTSLRLLDSCLFCVRNKPFKWLFSHPFRTWILAQLSGWQLRVVDGWKIVRQSPIIHLMLGSFWLVQEQMNNVLVMDDIALSSGKEGIYCNKSDSSAFCFINLYSVFNSLVRWIFHIRVKRIVVHASVDILRFKQWVTMAIKHTGKCRPFCFWI